MSCDSNVSTHSWVDIQSIVGSAEEAHLDQRVMIVPKKKWKNGYVERQMNGKTDMLNDEEGQGQCCGFMAATIERGSDV